MKKLMVLDIISFIGNEFLKKYGHITNVYDYDGFETHRVFTDNLLNEIEDHENIIVYDDEIAFVITDNEEETRVKYGDSISDTLKETLTLMILNKASAVCDTLFVPASDLEIFIDFNEEFSRREDIDTWIDSKIDLVKELANWDDLTPSLELNYNVG